MRLVVRRVHRYMREMGMCAIYPSPNPEPAQPAPSRLSIRGSRGLAITRPNQVWGVDITYIRLLAGWLYLVAILDWYSRFVVSWELSDTLEIEFVLAAVERALRQGRPAIWNSDQGSQFTSPQYVARAGLGGG